jgi:hypothetical protein
MQKHWSAKKYLTYWAKNVNTLYIHSATLTASVGAIFQWQFRPSELSAVLS